MFQIVLATFAEAQAELVIFVVAVCIHVLIFGAHRIKSEKQRNRATEQDHGGQRDGRARTPQSQEAVSLTRAVKTSLRKAPTVEDLARDVEEEIQKCTPEGAAHALVGLLEGLGKSVTPAVLGAVRQVRARRALEHSQRLSELLLRGYFTSESWASFKEFLAGVDAAGHSTPSISVLALKVAVKSADFEAAMRALKTLAGPMQEAATASASAAPRQLLQQTILLAIETSSMPVFLQGLCTCGLFIPWIVESLIRECSKAGDSKGVREVECLARERGVELTVAAYATLIREASAPSAAAALLEEALGRGLEPTAVLVATAEVATAQSDVTLANTVLQRFQERPAPLVAVSLICLTAKGVLANEDPDAAVLELYEKYLQGLMLRPSELRSQAVRLIAEASVRCRRLDILQQVLAVAGENFRYGILFKNLRAENRLEYAFAIFNACPEKTCVLYNSLLEICIDCKDTGAAERVMVAAVTAKAADVVTHNTIIKMHAQSGDLRRACAGIEQMREAGIAPNHVTFNELVDAQVKVNREGAWALIEEMKACALEPNQVTCSILLKSIQPGIRDADIRRTMAIVASLENEMDEILFSSFCEACIRIKRSDILERQLHLQLNQRRVQINGAYTFGSIIRAYGFLKDLQGVWTVWSGMRDRDILPTSTTLGCMTEALVNNDGPEAGYNLICEVLGDVDLKERVNAIVYCSVLKGFCHQRRFDRVWSVYKEMLDLKLKFSLVTYNTLIDACARCREVQRIPAILTDMAKKNIEPNVITYSTIIKGYCQENRLNEAFELLEKMKRDPTCKPDDFTYNTLLDGCACQGLLDKGLVVIQDMQKQGVSPSNFTLSLAAKLGNRSGRVDTAFHLCEDLAKRYKLSWNVHVYNNLLHACTNHNRNRWAQDLFSQMLTENVHPDVRTYTLLIRGLLSEGDADEVAALVRAANGLPGGVPRLSWFNSSLLALRGDLPEDILVEALNGIASIGGNHKAAQLLRDLKQLPAFQNNPKLLRTLKGIHAR